MQWLPSAPLSGIVKHYLLLEQHAGSHMNFRIIPDGNPGLVFHFKDPLISHTPGFPKKSQPRSFMYGQISHYNDLLSPGNLTMLVVVLQPDGIRSLLRTSARELADSVIDLRDLFGQEVALLQDMAVLSGPAQNFETALEAILLKKYARAKNIDPVIEQSLALISEARGAITIDRLLKQIPVTERQLERKFNEYVGTSPKKFTDIIRLRHFLKVMKSKHGNSKISDSVYDCGYYDPSHLNGYFRRTTGMTPKQYLLNNGHLAINFMQLPDNA